MTTATDTLLTAEEFARLPDRGMREELVQGRVVMTPPAGEEHGTVLGNLAAFVLPFVRTHRLGRVVVGDSGIVLTRNPDTIRAPDMAFIRAARILPGPPSRGYPAVLPDLVVEVRSPSDRWNDVMDKVNEYLVVGISAVVIDPGSQSVHVFEPNQPARILGPADVFDLPALWPGLAFPVADLFV